LNDFDAVFELGDGLEASDTINLNGLVQFKLLDCKWEFSCH
jgi:hypothetical protein